MKMLNVKIIVSDLDGGLK